MSIKPRESSHTGVAGAIKVRRAVLLDFPAILEISNWAISETAASFKTEPDTLEQWIDPWKATAERYPWFVAHSDGSVIGFAMASRFHSRCAYAHTAEVSVYVHPDHHGKGIGQALYHRLIPTLKAQGYRTLMAVIAVPNAASERLHTKFDFRRIGKLVGVGRKFGRWHDVVYWQLMLNEGDDEPAPIKAVQEVCVDCGETS